MAVPAKSHWMEIWGILLDKRRTSSGWLTCLKKQPPRVAFRNNDIYMVNGEENDPYEEPKERNVRVFYKLKVNADLALKNMPHKEDFDDDNYESIEEKETAVWSPPHNLKILHILTWMCTIFWCVNVYCIMCIEVLKSWIYDISCHYSQYFIPSKM